MASAVSSIATTRLLLRVPELADAEPLMAVCWDPEVLARKQVMLREQPGGIELALKNTEHAAAGADGHGQWTAVESATGQVIGCVGFYHPPQAWPGVDLGWVLHRSRWGHGPATEAATPPVHVYAVGRP